MPIKFSKDEQAFIDGKLDQNAMEDFLVKNIGNMELNNRVYQELHPKQNKLEDKLTPQNSDRDDHLQLLERWTYKTPTAQEIKAIANKITIAKQLQEQGIELLPEEKISLLELKQISRFSLLLGKKDSFSEGDEENKKAKDSFTGYLQSGQGTTKKKPLLELISNKSNNKEFKELYENMVVCEQLAADLRENIFSDIYKGGDILIRNEAKSAVIENVAQKGIKHSPIQIVISDNYSASRSNLKLTLLQASKELAQGMATMSSIVSELSDSIRPTETMTNKIDTSTLNTTQITSYKTKIFSPTDILSSNIYRLSQAQLENKDLKQQISDEKDPQKLEALLIQKGAEKVPNSIAEEFVRTEDVKKSKTFNNIEDNLANTLETLAKSATNLEVFVAQARPRIEAYLAVADLENNKTTPNVTAIDTELKNLYQDRNKSGIKAEIIKFISTTLVTLGLKKSTAEKTIQKISGKFTDKVLHSREQKDNKNTIQH